MLDAVEIMENNIERLVSEWIDIQYDVPEGSFKCPSCLEIFDYEPIQAYNAPDSPVCCYDCLEKDLKDSYNTLEEQIEIPY